jgi:carboxypeptidase PM20D1
VPDQYFDKLKRALKKVYTDAEVISLIVPASDDNNYFRAKGIPTFGILPIFLDSDLMSSIHNVNERIPIESLEHGVHVYENLIHSILFETELISETEEK